MKILSVLAALILAAFLPAIAQAQAGAEAAWTYEQPDPAGDVEPDAAVEWADVTSLRAGMAPDGALVFEMKFVNLEKITGNMRYCIFFEIDGKAFQTGAKWAGVAANEVSAVSAFAACSWTDSGTSVGSPTLDMEGDRILSTIPPSDDIALGMTLSKISLQVGLSTASAPAGNPSFFDTLTPSIEPVDYVFAPAGAGSADIAATVASATASAKPGETASYALTFTNAGTSAGTVTLAAEGLPEGYAASFDSETVEVPAGGNATATVSVEVPASAANGEVPFQVTVSDASGSQAIDLTLTVSKEGGSAPSGTPTATATESPTATSAATGANETAEPASTEETGEKKDTPGVGLVAFVAAVVAIIVFLRRRT